MVGGGGMAWRGDGERAAEGGPGPGAAAVWFRLVIIWPHALAAVWPPTCDMAMRNKRSCTHMRVQQWLALHYS